MEQTEKQFRSPPNAGQGILVEAGRDSARAAAGRFAPRNLKNAFAQPPGKPRLAIFIEAISTVFEKIPADLLSVCNWDLRFCTKASAAYISRSSVSSHSDKPLRYNVY
jgi:hypothetical protein